MLHRPGWCSSRCAADVWISSSNDPADGGATRHHVMGCRPGGLVGTAGAFGAGPPTVGDRGRLVLLIYHGRVRGHDVWVVALTGGPSPCYDLEDPHPRGGQEPSGWVLAP
jgi:predicted GH43/DUF377 family glycosyl hydrolase